MVLLHFTRIYKQLSTILYFVRIGGTHVPTGEMYGFSRAHLDRSGYEGNQEASIEGKYQKVPAPVILWNRHPKRLL